MKVEFEILLNQLAQNIKPIEFGREWFDGLDDLSKQNVLQKLTHYSIQARASCDDVDQAIVDSELKPTFTPCKLIRAGCAQSTVGQGGLNTYLYKLCSLPKNEREKSFRLLLSLYSIADQRRRENLCDDDCSHWWHSNLSDPAIVNNLLART